MQIKFIPSPSIESLHALYQTEKSVNWRFWGKWLLALAAVSLIFSVSIDIAPVLFGDEFMNVDLGRVILHPETDWSICWITNRDQPALVYFYVGTVLQELIFQVVGQYGPRVFALVGALAAATAMVGWLLARNTLPSAALVLGLVFLLDPLFVQAYTMGRLDGWTMALSIASCWILRDATHRFIYEKPFKRRVILAGVLTTVSFYTWASSVFLLPLILLELTNLVTARGLHKSWENTRALLVLFGISCMVMGILLLLPIVPQLYSQLNNIIESLATNTRPAPELAEQPIYLRIIIPFINLLRDLKFTPVLLLVAMIGTIRRLELGMVFAGMAATLLMICTLVYMHRVQYLLPYLIAFTAGIYQMDVSYNYNHAYKPFIHSVKIGMLAALLIWSSGFSIGIRSILAFNKPEERDRDLIYLAAQSMIGQGSHSVLTPLEFYYPGRSLGWKMYKPYLAWGVTPSSEEWRRILSHVDYVILLENEATENFVQLLNAEGMHDKGWHHIYDDLIEADDGKPTNDKRVRNLYKIYHHPYGPYRLFAREPNNAATAQTH